MSIGLIKETISLRKDLLQKDKEYTNELLVDEIISYLGYNKRLDAGVNRRISDDIDWEIIDEAKNISMMVKVFSYGYNPNQDDIDRIATLGKEKNYSVCLITDGENILVIRPYNKLYGTFKLNLFNENAKTKDVLEALSKNNNNESVIDYYYYKELMTSEVIEKTIESKKDSIAKDILSELGCPDEDEFLNTVIEALSKVYDKTIHSAETLELKQKINDTELELGQAKDSIEVLTGKLEIVQNELQNKQNELELQKSEIENKQFELDSKQSELEEKEKFLCERQAELDKYKKDVEELSLKNSELQSSIENEHVIQSELHQKIEEFEKAEKLRVEQESLIEDDLGDSDEEIVNEEVEQFKIELEILTVERDQLLKDKSALEDSQNELIEAKKTLEDEINTLNDEISKLNKVIDGLRASSQSITLSKEPVVVSPQNIALVDNNIESLASEIVNKIKTSSSDVDASMDDELRKLQDYIYNLELSLSNAKRMVEDLNSEKEELLAEKAKLQRTVDENTIKIDELSRKYDDTLKELRLVRSDKEELEQQNKDLSKYLEQSRQKNEEILNGNGIADASSGTDVIMANYRVQIEDLSSKLAISEENVDYYKKEYEAIKQKLDDLSSNKQKRVDELLDCISDSDEITRTYVGVIQEELYQTESLNKFIGMSLQKLYEIKAFEASNYIFNGDIFSLIQNGENRDLIINSKSYDIDISHIAEDEALNKLRVIFSKFNDISFGCKKIGVLPTHEAAKAGEFDSGDYTDEDIELGYNNTEYSDESEVYQGEYLEDGSYEETVYDESGYGKSYGENGYADEYSTEDNILYVSQFNEVEQLTELVELKLNAVRYIVSSNKTFIVSRDYEEITLEKMLSKSIDALLAMAKSIGYYNITKEFTDIDLVSLSSSFDTINGTSDDRVRIFGGKYVVTNVDSAYTIINIIKDISNNLQLDMQDVWIYLDGETESDEIIELYGAYENTIAVYENSVYESNEEYSKGYSIIPGYLPDIIPMTRNSMIAHKDILRNVVAVKSDRIALAVKNKLDCIKVIKALFETATNDGITVNLDAIGTIVNDTRQIVYNKNDNLDFEYHEFECNDTIYYIPDMEVYQYIYSIIKVQAGLFLNKKIAVKAEIDMDALSFYKDYFESCEPSLTLAIGELVEFISEKSKS